MQSYRHSLVAGCAALLAVTAQAQNPARDSDAAENASAEYRQSLPYQEYLKGHNLRASELIGAQVRNPENESLGEIEELVIASGRDMVVLSVGGLLHVGDKLVAVPYEELRVSPDGDAFYVNRTKEQLEAAPAYSYDRQEAQPARTAAAPAARDTDERGADRTAPTRETAQTEIQTAQTEIQKEIGEAQRELQRETDEGQREIQRAANDDADDDGAERTDAAGQTVAGEAAIQREATEAQREIQRETDEAQHEIQRAAVDNTDDDVGERAADTRQTAAGDTEIKREVSEAQREVQQESNEAQREIQRAANAAERENRDNADDRDGDIDVRRESAQRSPAADTEQPRQTAATRPSATAATALGKDDYRGSNLIGASVLDSSGDKIAEIDDLVLSTVDKKVHAVLSVGGVAGIGAKLVSIPLDDLKISADDDPQNVTVRVDTTADQLHSKPEFRYERQAALDRAGPGA